MHTIARLKRLKSLRATRPPMTPGPSSALTLVVVAVLSSLGGVLWDEVVRGISEAPAAAAPALSVPAPGPSPGEPERLDARRRLSRRKARRTRRPSPRPPGLGSAPPEDQAPLAGFRAAGWLVLVGALAAAGGIWLGRRSRPAADGAPDPAPVLAGDGVCSPVEAPLDEPAAPFFVVKKDGPRQRLVIDARAANASYRAPSWSAPDDQAQPRPVRYC